VQVPLLETERLRFRAPSIDDFEDEAAFYATERSANVGGPLSPNKVWRMLAMIIGHWTVRGYGFWAIEDKATGRYCGRVGCWYPLGWPEREIGWTLMDHAEGRGFAYEAAMAARVHAYSVMGWTTAISLIVPGNTRSIALAERMGAVLERTYDHPGAGPVSIYRHPAPEALQ